MNALFFYLIIITLSCTGVGKAEEEFSCPFDNESKKYKGFKRDGVCYTLLLRKGIHRKGAASISRFTTLCKRIFKKANLYAFDQSRDLDFWSPPKEAPPGQIYNGNNTDKAVAFLCEHEPYANCLSTNLTSCVYDSNFKRCFLLEQLRVLKSRELPFGRKCLSNDSKDKKTFTSCPCPKCDRTTWTVWNHFVDDNEHKVFTRYRPKDDRPNRNCMTNTNDCCYQIAIPQLNVYNNERLTQVLSKISCTNNGFPHPQRSHSKTCDCEKSYTGIFCEIYAAGCQSNGCENGGVCKQIDDYYYCQCVNGTLGRNCNETVLSDPLNFENVKSKSWLIIIVIVAFVCVGVALSIMKMDSRRNYKYATVPFEINERAGEEKLGWARNLFDTEERLGLYSMALEAFYKRNGPWKI